MGDQAMKVLLYNHSGCENRGCEALVRTTSALFSAAGAQVLASSDQPEYDKTVGLPDVHKILSSTISPYSIHRLINSVGFRLGMPREHEVARKYHPVIQAGSRCDVCLSIGGDTYCYQPQEHMAVINSRLHQKGRPIVLWGCSVDPERLQGQLLEDLRAYDLIVARESITADAMRKKGLPVRTFCDPAFFLEAEELPLPQGWREGNTIGLNVSPLVLNCAKDKTAALEAFCALVEHILKTSDCAVALVPHVTWPHDNDLDALGRIKERFAEEERVLLLPGTLNAVQYKGYIKRLRALVTARTHASIAAYSTAVPTLVIGYSVKARGIARDLFGSEEGHLITAQELEHAVQLTSAYDELMKREADERAFLEKRLPDYKAGREETIRAVLSQKMRN